MARTDLWDRASQRALPLWLPVALAALIVARVISSRYGVESARDLVRWMPAESAERYAATAHKPLLYEFSADWCGPCHLMESEVFRDAALAALINERFVAVKLVDRQRESGTNPPDVARLQRQYGVDAFPTVVIAQGGQAPRKMIGYPGKSGFEQFLRGKR